MSHHVWKYQSSNGSRFVLESGNERLIHGNMLHYGPLRTTSPINVDSFSKLVWEKKTLSVIPQTYMVHGSPLWRMYCTLKMRVQVSYVGQVEPRRINEKLTAPQNVDEKDTFFSKETRNDLRSTLCNELNAFIPAKFIVFF